MFTLRAVLLFTLGLADAQLVSLGIDGAVNLPTLTQSCPPVLTITVLPPDYTGIFTNLAGLPTLSVPSLNLPTLSLNLPTALPAMTLPFSLPTAIPTNLLPSVTLALPTISLPVSALLPTSLLAGPTPTPVAYTCPEYDGQTIFENGLLYVLSCGASATGSIYATVTANSSFNDCFTACDQSNPPTLLGALFCTGFSFVPNASGNGGLCYLQNSPGQGLSNGGTGRVAAVRLLNYILGGNLLAPVFSNLPTLSLSTPTNLPTFALPTVSLPVITGNPLSSALNDLSSNLAGLSTLAPAPTNNPLSSVLNDLSSNIAGLSTLVPAPTNNPLSSVLNDLSSNLAGLSTLVPAPTNQPLSSLLNDLSSDLAGLSTLAPVPTNNPLSSKLNDLSSNLAGFSTLVPVVSLPTPVSTDPLAGLSTLLSLSVPSFNLETLIPTATATPSLNLPSISLATPSIDLGQLTTVLNGLTTLLPVPSISVPSISLPSISLSAGSLSLPSIAVSVPSSTNILGGLSTALVLPTTNILPGLPGLPTLIPAASSVAAASSSAAVASSRASSSAASVAAASSGTTITSNAAPSATTAPVFSCPADNNLSYLSSTGQAFIVKCGTVYNGYDISSSVLQPNLASCVNSCGSVAGCTSVSYSLGICAYKSAAPIGVASTIADSAAPLDLSCPAGNGNTYLDYLGGNYQVLCNTTFPAATLITSAGTKRDLARRAAVPAVANAVSCSARCTSLVGCIGSIASKTTALCQLFSAFGNAGVGSTDIDAIVGIGRRFVEVVSGSTVTSTSRATGVPSYTTRTGSAINNAPTTTTSTLALPTLSLPNVSVSVAASIGLGVGVDGLPLPAATTTSAAQVTLVLPVTTIRVTSTFTSCNQGNNGFITCPVISVTNTLLSTGLALPTAALPGL